MSAQGQNRVKEGGREMLTAKEIGQFHRDGVLALRGVFDREEVRALQRAADEVTAEAVAGRGHGHGYREVDGRRQYYRTDGVLWDHDAAFQMATVNPNLLSAVGQCLGHPFVPINDSLVVKLPIPAWRSGGTRIRPTRDRMAFRTR